MSSRATGLAGAPDVPAINGLLAQVQALLGGGLPAVPGLDGLLNTVRGLAGIAGLDTSILSGLLSTRTCCWCTAASPTSSAG
jgi:hypothetical protein